MSTLTKNVVTSPEEYLDGEQYSDVRHEYVGGRLYAMVGASEAHNRVALNLASLLNAHLRAGPCRAFMADVKVNVGSAFYYPDVFVTRAPGDAHPLYKTQPVLVAEVLSPSTLERDTLAKRAAYQSLDSLKEYVLVAQDKMDVRIYRRSAEGWDLESCSAGDVVALDSVGLHFPIETLYVDVWR